MTGHTGTNVMDIQVIITKENVSKLLKLFGTKCDGYSSQKLLP